MYGESPYSMTMFASGVVEGTIISCIPSGLSSNKKTSENAQLSFTCGSVILSIATSCMLDTIPTLEHSNS